MLGVSGYTIENNIIENNEDDGILLINSGSTAFGCSINDNVIINNSYPATLSTWGVIIFNSHANLSANSIINNDGGILTSQNSNVAIEGNETATNETETQRIKNNTTTQIYSYYNAFPRTTEYNVIYKDNSRDPIIICDNFTGYQGELVVSNNFWGRDFDYTIHLDPPNAYRYDPVWNIDGATGDGENMAGIMYTNAISLINSGECFEAKALLKLIITEYPLSKSAEAAAKELLTLEGKSGQDFGGLKAYYDTEPNLKLNEKITSMAEYLSIQCDIKMQNYQAAIEYFEAIIDNPPSDAEYLFAVLDLGYVYLLMEGSGSRNSFQGKHSELIPLSKEDYYETTSDAFNKLFNMKGSHHLLQTQPAKLISHGNYPNPFNPITNINFELPENGNVRLDIYNIKGQLIKTLINSEYEAGSHSVVWDGKNNGNADVSSGIYFYRIEAEGQEPLTKKMILMK